MRIGVRSGGHSWAGNHVRDGGPAARPLAARPRRRSTPGAMTASVQPGCRGNELVAALAEQDLFFPAGHCVGVAVGGYLLQGGFGWNGRVHGPACMSVEAIDVVTAAGELVRADAEQQRRPALGRARIGPGLLRRRHALPPARVSAAEGRGQRRLPLPDRRARRGVPLGARDRPARAARDGADARDPPRRGRRARDRRDRAGARGHRRARRARRWRCWRPARCSTGRSSPLPVRARAARGPLRGACTRPIPTTTATPSTTCGRTRRSTTCCPGLRRIAETLPEAPVAHAVDELGSAQPAARPDMAYSVEDETYIALYGVWEDAARTTPRTSPGPPTACARWSTSRRGIQLADENLGLRPARFVSDAHLTRARRAPRARTTRTGRFHPWMGRP